MANWPKARKRHTCTVCLRSNILKGSVYRSDCLNAWDFAGIYRMVNGVLTIIPKPMIWFRTKECDACRELLRYLLFGILLQEEVK